MSDARKVVILAGAGCTFSDASKASARQRPPLDKKFFSECLKSGDNEVIERVNRIAEYMQNKYKTSIFHEEVDSLEQVMSRLYVDIFSRTLEDEALPTFRDLVRAYNARLAETTNNLNPTPRSRLFRILDYFLDGMETRVELKNITIITFNQDLQIEKTLNRLQNAPKYRKRMNLFNFPYCYSIPRDSYVVTRPHEDVERFEGRRGLNEDSITILKLHGSLNWFSNHKSPDIPLSSMFNPKRKLYITPRKTIAELTYTSAKRSWYTFPIIVPPVAHKSAIFHDVLQPIWEIAEDKLRTATTILIFGYSCPVFDQESTNLIQRSVRENIARGNLKDLTIIDPNPDIIRRYMEITDSEKIYYYRLADIFLDAP